MGLFKRKPKETEKVEETKTEKTSESKSKKSALVAKGKELGLNLKSSMSIYELEHRISEREAELAKEKEKSEKKESTSKRVRGEH